MSRPAIDHYMMAMALLAGTRATCVRRSVGCVLTNDLHHIMATGYNGVPRGMVHCIDNPCGGANSKSGTGLDLCMANHAEQNALLQCKDVEKIHTCYSTTAPCITCTKLLLNTSCKRIVFLEDYPHGDSRKIWINSCRAWTIITPRDQIAVQQLLQGLSNSPTLIRPTQ